MTPEQFRAAIRAACDTAGSQTEWAAKHGISAAYVSDVVNGRRDPGKMLLAAMKMERVVSYRPTER